MAKGLQGPLNGQMVHLCIDMQRIFSTDGLWAAPWMNRVLPVVVEIATQHVERTIFTRFITPLKAQDMPGMWCRYYQRWDEATQQKLDLGMLELLPALKALAPPAFIVDKTRYSAFSSPALLSCLQSQGAEGLVVTSAETDVCVLSTVLDAVDLGYRVIVVRDGVCSSSDEGHDALLDLYHQRYSLQVETADAAEILASWRVA